ncbi:MAG TPA: hypothetical protein VKT76_11255 [Bradyrhizobium sp.]|nr:hypothetical protein [Bradyrhizobium sp.]
MSNITLTAAVRQNLLSLQDTASLLSQTQERLATGKKVNSALDNPTNFFTAAGLDARSGDIANLLDSISNGVQVLQAADTGITSLQKLIDTAKSIANQALQQPSGFSTQSSIAFTATTGSPSNAGSGADQATSGDLTTSKLNGSVFKFTNASGTAVSIAISPPPSQAFNPATKTATVQSLNQLNQVLADAGVNLSAIITGTDGLTFTSTNDGAAQTITNTGSAPTSPDAIDVSVVAATAITGNAVSSVSVAQLTPTTVTSGTALKDSANANVTAATSLNSAAGTHLATATLSALAGQTLVINGNTIAFSSTATSTVFSGANTTIGLGSGTASTFGDILQAVQDAANNTPPPPAPAGPATATLNNGAIVLTTGGAAGTAQNAFNITSGTGAGTAANILGITSVTPGGGGQTPAAFNNATSLEGPIAAGPAVPNTLSSGFKVGDTITVNGQLLTFVASGAAGNNQINITDSVEPTLLAKIDALSGNTGPGTTPSSVNANSQIVLHAGTGGSLSITSTNTAALAALGLPNPANIQSFATPTTVSAVPDPSGQSARATLVSQYNQILTQITTTAQDASFNGINLLNGNSLKLIFDETGKSALTIGGVTFDPAGLGLTSLTPGTDFIDNVHTEQVLTSLNNASLTLRTQASAFGANLSIVQIRQDFNKNLINVLQTGSSNLTLADSNEEAANSQALATRQSIATSALALANQSQQGVLQLLR